MKAELVKEYEHGLIKDAYIRQQRKVWGTPIGTIEPHLRKRVEGLLERCKVFVDREDGIVLGFVIAELRGKKLVIHHLFVKNSWRRQGRAARLLALAAKELGGYELVYTCKVRQRERDWGDRLNGKYIDYEWLMSGGKEAA